MKKEKKKLKTTKSKFIVHSTTFYSFMILIGLYIGSFDIKKFKQSFLFLSPTWSLEHLVIACIISIFMLLTTAQLFKLIFPSYTRHKQYIFSIIGTLSIWEIILISPLSAFGEEILFRVALQPHIGVALTSIFVGCLQLGPRARFTALTSFSIIRNCIFGILFYYTKVIWVSFLAHTIVNIIYLFSLSELKAKFSTKKTAK